MTIRAGRPDTGARIDRDELLARINLRNVLDALAEGTGNDRQRRWRCPDSEHPDIHPSVTITSGQRSVERWRCWSGGHGGTAIDAVIAARQLTVGESIRWLNDHHAHLEPLPRPTPAWDPPPIGQPSRHVIEYVERCEQLLFTRSGTEVREWLNRRGLPDDVLIANRVGADPENEHLRRRGPASGSAAIYPALDRQGNITYFQARLLNPPTGRSKYDNPSRHSASNPKLAWTRRVGSEPNIGPLVVTEGIADALTAASVGMTSVGVLGSMTPNEQTAQQLVSATRDGPRNRRILICFDSDQPGRTGAQRLASLINNRDAGSIADLVEPPHGMDLSEWAVHDDQWIQRLRTESPPISLRPIQTGRRTRPDIDLDL